MRKYLALMLLLLTLPHVFAQATVEKVVVDVYDSGYVRVTEVVVPSNYSVAVEVPLMSNDTTGLSVFDENGNPLLFEKNGSVLTVYILNSTTQFTVTYFTASLTSKKGNVWNLSYSFPYPVTIKLPSGAIVVDLSDVPLEITSSSITMPPGNQSVSYVLPFPPTTTSSSQSSTFTTSTSTPTESSTSTTTSTKTTRTYSSPATTSANTQSSTPLPSQPSSGAGFLPVLSLLAIITIPAVAYWVRNRRRPNRLPVSKDKLSEKLESLGLTEEEIKALIYVYDRGGKAKQADVRKALGIPKTTAWRMFKRLEEKGLVRVYKRGKENWVELIFT